MAARTAVSFKVLVHHVRYRWSQSLDEITLECKVSSDEKVDNKQLKVDIKSERVVIKYKGDVILEGKLHERIQPEESIWNLEDKKRVVLNLEKVRIFKLQC